VSAAFDDRRSIIDYAGQQGLIPRQIEVDELFGETTRTLER
jgi:hypothetical protein